MSDNQETGPLSLEDAISALAIPDEGATDEPEAEATQDVETVEAEADEAEADENSESETDESESDADESEEPQHLELNEYGSLTTTVRINGQDVKVNLDELAKGYSRQQDYSRKTNALAEERKAFDAEKSAAEQRLSALKRQLDEQLAAEVEKEPDWVKLMEDDPFEATKQKMLWDRKKADQDAARQRLQAQRASDMQRYAQKTAQMALDRIPEWSDPAKARATADARRQVAIDAGFTNEEYDSSPDMRFAVLLEWARIGRESQKSVEKVVKTVAKAPKVLKPGAAKTSVEKKADRTAAKSRILSRPHTMEEHLKAMFE